MIAQRIFSFFTRVGRYALFCQQLFLSLFRPPWRIKESLDQFEFIGIRSLSLIGFSHIAVGIIFSLQFYAQAQALQRQNLIGLFVGLSISREIAPVITSLLLIGRIGSATTSQIGAMKITEQLDAMRLMSVDPVQYLCVPRLIASIIAFPLLTAFANITAMVSSYLISIYFLNIPSGAFLDPIYTGVYPLDVISGMLKAAVMGVITITICCFRGLDLSATSRGVSEASTKAVVESSILILIADYFLTSIMLPTLYSEGGVFR